MNLSEQIDEVADRFEAAWKATGKPRIEDFLEDCDPADRLGLLTELIRIDAAYRRLLGEAPGVPQYLAEFPELKDNEGAVRELSQFLSGLDDEGAASVETEARPARDARARLSEPRTLGRFTLLEELGSGAFGTVYRAYDRRLDRHVAVKVLRGAAAGAKERTRFLREAQNVAQLRHESIVPIYEAGEHEGAPYLVSELIAGTTLAKMPPDRVGRREAAAIVAAIARALHYAHEQGIVHRDVAPSNILLDARGRAFLTDFGLAKRIAGASITADGQVLGTPAYMSPEQAAGRIEHIDRRTDVYSLGVVLYELLTGERPFRGELRMLLWQVQFEEPRPPRRCDDGIPRDLETICLKAMAKEPARRYQTAGELGDDLTRFLEGAPIHARPVSRATRALRFCRKHWMAILPAAMAVLAAVTAGVVLIAGAHIEAENRRREAVVERLQRLRMSERRNGWSDRALEMVRQAAEIRRDADLRDFAAAALGGLDARIVKQFEDHSASSAAFDAEGKRLLLGGYHDERWGAFDDQRAQLLAFDLRRGAPEDRPAALGLAGSGPVAFSPDGTPLQLAVIEADGAALYDLAAQRLLKTFQIPGAADADRDERIQRAHPRPLVALAADGSRVAAAARLAKDRGLVIAWDAATGEELQQWRCAASALAFSPDGSLLAAGDAQGRITIWPVLEEAGETTLHAAPNEIASLAFQHNPRWAENAASWRGPWLLAAGDAGGAVTVWNPAAGVPVAFCRGAHYRVTAVAFNPDATLLACGAHAEVRIWDVAAGRCLLRVDPLASGGGALQRVSGLAFSPDGRFLAIASLGQWSPPTAVVLEMEDGRGIRTYRGLSGQIARIAFSPDDRCVAALSHRWEIGVWRVSDGRLRRVFDAPAGATADNAALALSADGRRVAFSTARHGRLWEMESGNIVDSWELPPGLQDDLAYAPGGELHLVRWDTDDRVCRVRRLKPGGELELISEVHDFQRWRVKNLLLAPDASYFLACAELTQPGKETRSRTRVFDAASGRRIWPPEGPEGDAQTADGFVAGRSGALPATSAADGRCPIYEPSSGRLLSVTPPHATHVGAGRRFAAGGPRRIGDERLGHTVYRFGADEPLVTLGIDRPIASAWPQFSLDETLLAWGRHDGSLRIADLPAMQRRLARFGLGW